MKTQTLHCFIARKRKDSLMKFIENGKSKMSYLKGHLGRAFFQPTYYCTHEQNPHENLGLCSFLVESEICSSKVFLFHNPQNEDQYGGQWRCCQAKKTDFPVSIEPMFPINTPRISSRDSSQLCGRGVWGRCGGARCPSYCIAHRRPAFVSGRASGVFRSKV